MKYTVGAGHSSTGITLNSSDTMTVLHGGTAIDTIDRSGSVTDFGKTISTVVSSAGRETVRSGGAASHTVVSSGGEQFVSSAGVASGTVARYGGTEDVLGGGKASGTIVRGGGLQGVGFVSSGTAVT